ncbi:MAG: 4-hydroxythreonine-4-phosphate dehydrogenase PdxA [Pseudomonadota bacterium]
MNNHTRLPRLGLLLGDRYGVGPELVGKLINNPPELQSQVIVVGDRRVLELGLKAAGGGAVPDAVEPDQTEDDMPGIAFQDFSSPDIAAEPRGEVAAAVGSEVLKQLETLASLCRQGVLDGFVFAPLNKQSMRLGGLNGQDELDHLVGSIDFSGAVGEINILGDLWTTRVTAHVPLRDVADAITEASVLAAIELAATSLARAGQQNPTIAVSGLNPHAGDGGAFGREEIEIIAPAIEQANRMSIKAFGPYSPDTVFLQAPRDGHRAIVTMYHDQGQIAMKLMGFGKGVTLHAGLPFPVTTPAHGTAFDIAGQGVATPEGLYAALAVAEQMAMAPRS